MHQTHLRSSKHSLFRHFDPAWDSLWLIVKASWTTTRYHSLACNLLSSSCSWPLTTQKFMATAKCQAAIFNSLEPWLRKIDLTWSRRGKSLLLIWRRNMRFLLYQTVAPSFALPAPCFVMPLQCNPWKYATLEKGSSSSQLSWARWQEKSPVRGVFLAHLKAKTLAKGHVNLHLFLSNLGPILGTKLRMTKVVAQLSAPENCPSEALRPTLARPKFSTPLVTLPLILDGNFAAFATKSLASSNQSDTSAM